MIPSHDSLDLLRSLAPDGEGPGRGELVARLAEHVARRQSQGVLDRDAAGEWGAALVELVAGGATDPAFDWLAVARALAARGERRAEDGLLELADLLFDARIQPRNSYQVAAYVRDLIRDGHPRLASLHEEARPNDPSGVTRFVSERGRWARPASEHPAAVSWSRAIEGLDEVACRAEVRALRAALEARYLAGFPMVDLDPRTPTFSGEYTEATAALLADQLARVAPAALERGFLFLRGMKNLGSDLDYLYVGPGRGAWTPLLDERMRALGYCVDVHQRERVAAQLESGELSQYSRCYLMQLDFCAGDAQAHRHFVETTLAGYALERDRGGARFGERVLNSQAERMERFVDLVNESAQRPTSVKAVCLRALEDYLLALRCEAEVLDCGDAAVAIRSLLCAGAIAAEEARFLMETYDLILWTRNALHYQKGCNSNVLGREVLRPACEFFGVDAERLLERLAGRGRELARRADHFSKHKAA